MPLDFDSSEKTRRPAHRSAPEPSRRPRAAAPALSLQASSSWLLLKKTVVRDRGHEDMRNAMARVRELTAERDEFKAQAEKAEARLRSREEELRAELAELREAQRADAASLARSLASRARERKEAEARFEIERDAAAAASAAAQACSFSALTKAGLPLSRSRSATSPASSRNLSALSTAP